MKNLIVDFDNTQFNTLPSLAEYINKMFEIKTTPEDHRFLSIDQVLEKYGVKTFYTLDQIYYYFISHYQSSIRWHNLVKPMPGLTEVFPRLAKKYNIYTCSSRQASSLSIMQDLSKKHVPGCIKDIHCVYTYVGPGYTGISKAEFVKNLPGETIMFIDDSPKELVTVKDLVPTILFGETDNNTHKLAIAKDWWEVEKILESAP
jgi:5'(3')-deoxyribonucleotidase